MTRYRINPMFRRGIAGLGDASSSQVSIDTQELLNTGDSLRQAQGDLTTLLTAMQANPNLARTIGPDVVAQQQALGDLISKYVGVYTAIFGQAPVGLGQVLVIGAVAAVFVVVVAGLAVWWEKERALEQQAQAATIAGNNQAALIQQAQTLQQQASAAAAAGDTQTAATLQQQAQTLFVQAGTPGGSAGSPPPPPPAGGFLAWLEQNWITAVMIAGGIWIVSKAV